MVQNVEIEGCSGMTSWCEISFSGPNQSDPDDELFGLKGLKVRGLFDVKKDVMVTI